MGSKLCCETFSTTTNRQIFSSWMSSFRTLELSIPLSCQLLFSSGVYQPWLIKALGDWRVFNWILFSQATILCIPEIRSWAFRWFKNGKKQVKKTKTASFFRLFKNYCDSIKDFSVFVLGIAFWAYSQFYLKKIGVINDIL